MVIVFGSLNVDMVLPVEHLPPLGGTVLCPKYHLHPGGKGANQAVAAARAGADVKMFGCVGQDSFRDVLVRSLGEASVDIEGIEFTDQPTGCATICVDREGENVITVASGANLLATSTQVQDEFLTPGTTVLMQMEVPPSENWDLIKRAHAKGVRTILNLAPAQEIPKEILSLLSVLILNQVEALDLGKMLGLKTTSAIEVVQYVSQKYEITCIVTLGGKGAFASDGSSNWVVQAMEIQAIDTTSAGDAFCGVLAAALDGETPLDEALHRATVASGLTCLTLGAQASLPLEPQITQALSTVPKPVTVQKMKD